LIRISFWYSCDHKGSKMPVQEYKHLGSSPNDEKRYCYCTGEPKEMIRKITSKNLSPSLS